MAKHDKNPFGATLEEVDANIAKLNAERSEISKNVGTKKFKKKDNKRFEQISTDLEAANRARADFQPIASGTEEPFTEQRTEVKSDPNTITQTPGSATGLNTPTPAVGSVNLREGPIAGPGIGEIQVPGTNENQIVQSVLGDINGQGPTSVEAEINKSVFGQDPNTAQKVIQPQTPLIQQDASVSRGITDPINKGTVRGSIIGSQPVFVGGGDFFAADVVNNRKKAIQDQANARAQEANALLSIKPPIVKDQRFQKDLNSQFFGTMNKYTEEAKRVYGDDWDLALKDQSNPLGRAFVQDMANYDFIAGQADQVTDLFAEIDADLESGDSVFSDETLALRDEYNTLQGDFLGGNVTGAANLADEFNKLKGFTTLDKIVNDQNINIEGGLTIQRASIAEDDEKYVTTTQKVTAYEDQVRIIAKGLAKNQMRNAVNNGYITEDEIFDRLNARYGYESITTKKITTKPKGGGVKVEVSLDSDFGNPKDEKISDWEVTVLDEVNIPTEFEAVDATGLEEIGVNGQKTLVSGSRPVDFTDFQVGSYTDAEGNIQYESVAIGIHQEPDGLGGFKPVTKAYSLKQMRGRIITEGLMDEENFDNMITRFDSKIEQERSTTGGGSTTTTETTETTSGGGGTGNTGAALDILNQ